MGITQTCKIKFSISDSYVYEVECEVAALDSCEVMLGRPYLWDRDVSFYRREDKYFLFKGGKAYFVKVLVRKHTQKITHIAIK